MSPSLSTSEITAAISEKCTKIVKRSTLLLEYSTKFLPMSVNCGQLLEQTALLLNCYLTALCITAILYRTVLYK